MEPEHISKPLERLGQHGKNILTPNPLEQTDIQDERRELWERLGVSSLDHTFANFKPLHGTEEALGVFQSLALTQSDRKFILLTGVGGCGKTHLIEALIIEWWASCKILTRYFTMSQIVRRLKSAMNPTAAMPYEEMFKRLCTQSHLIIDDIGMGSIESKWEISDLEDIINERYHARYKTGAITILASNKDIKELPGRIVSRFYDLEFGKVLLIKAGDYRRRKLGGS